MSKKNNKQSKQVKAKEPKTPKKTAEIIAVVDRFADHFLMKDNIHMDLYKIKSFDLDSFSENELSFTVVLWERFYQSYGGDLKLISLNLPADTSVQQQYLQHKLDTTHNPVYTELLNQKHADLVDLEENDLERHFYMMTFSENEEDFRKNTDIIRARLVANSLVEDNFDYLDKVRVLAALGDKNIISLASSELYSSKVSRETQKTAAKKLGYNPYLISDIQPHGNITFNVERYIRTGTGYEACISVYGYPQRVGLYWMIPIMTMNRTIAVMDVHTPNQEETKRNLNESIKENEERFRNEDALTSKDVAVQRIQKLREYFAEIDQQGQVSKEINLRIYVAAKKFQDIDDEVESIITTLEGDAYKAAVYVNESYNDWTSQYKSFEQQKETPYSRRGQSCLSRTLAQGIPFYFTSVKDPSGTLLGYTNTSRGSCLLDIFSKSTKRLSYNALMIGTMGAGKSTTLKKLIADNAARGNYLRIIDPSGEYTELVTALGGSTISLDGSSGILNALEILRTTDEGESLCWVNHVSKLSACYALLAPDATTQEKSEFENQIGLFYERYGLIDFDEDLNEQQITGLPSYRYPTWSSFLNYIDETIDEMSEPANAVERQLMINQISRLDSIRINLRSVIKNYGYLIDGKTTIEGGLFSAPIVLFNAANLKKIQDRVCDMQMFLALQLCWDNAVQVGSNMKRLYETNQIAWDDITRFAIVIDESHEFLNASRIQLVKQATMIQREGRKYFTGLWLASQNIRDFVPEGTPNAEAKEITVMFELCEYKFLLRQDDNAMQLLSKVFSNILSEKDFEKIPTLELGSMILCLGADRKVQVQVMLSDEERDVFKGGA